jgi:hypothetical protein
MNLLTISPPSNSRGWYASASTNPHYLPNGAVVDAEVDAVAIGKAEDEISVVGERSELCQFFQGDLTEASLRASHGDTASTQESRAIE